jgi:hypothetical protein
MDLLSKENTFVPIAIYIAAPRTAHILMTLDRRIGELDYDRDLHEHYIVFDAFAPGQYVIMTVEQFDKMFDLGLGTEPWFFQPVLVNPK